MNVLLLRPDPGNERFGLGPFFRVEPLGLEYVGAALRGRGTRADDRRPALPPGRESWLRRTRPRVVGISCMHALEYDRVLETARAVRRAAPGRLHPRRRATPPRPSRGPSRPPRRRDLRGRRRGGRAGARRRARAGRTARDGPGAAPPDRGRLGLDAASGGAHEPRRGPAARRATSSTATAADTTACSSSRCGSSRRRAAAPSAATSARSGSSTTARSASARSAPSWRTSRGRRQRLHRRRSLLEPPRAQPRARRRRSTARGVRKRWVLVQTRTDLVCRHPELLEAWRPLAQDFDIFFGLEAASDAGLRASTKDAARPTERRGGAGSRARWATASRATSSSTRTGPRREFAELWDFVAAQRLPARRLHDPDPAAGDGALREAARPMLAGQPWFKYDMHHVLWEPRLGARASSSSTRRPGGARS